MSRIKKEWSSPELQQFYELSESAKQAALLRAARRVDVGELLTYFSHYIDRETARYLVEQYGNGTCCSYEGFARLPLSMVWQDNAPDEVVAKRIMFCRHQIEDIAAANLLPLYMNAVHNYRRIIGDRICLTSLYDVGPILTADMIKQLIANGLHIDNTAAQLGGATRCLSSIAILVCRADPEDAMQLLQSLATPLDLWGRQLNENPLLYNATRVFLRPDVQERIFRMSVLYMPQTVKEKYVIGFCDDGLISQLSSDARIAAAAICPRLMDKLSHAEADEAKKIRIKKAVSKL